MFNRRWVFVTLTIAVRCSRCRQKHRHMWFNRNRFICVHCWRS